MNRIPDDFKLRIEEISNELNNRLEQYKKEGSKDLEIDPIDLDKALLDIPKLKNKWLVRFTDETIYLKNTYALKEQIRMERWKYYNGKQTDEYVSKHGLVHEKILKSDIDKYMASDVKLEIVNNVVSLQKAIVDYVEEIIKELNNRGFHVRGIIDYRKFVNGS